MGIGKAEYYSGLVIWRLHGDVRETEEEEGEETEELVSQRWFILQKKLARLLPFDLKKKKDAKTETEIECTQENSSGIDPHVGSAARSGAPAEAPALTTS